MNTKVTGYLELSEYPDTPTSESPTLYDCVGYTFMSMVQLCNISQTLGRSRSEACNAFGGDNGDIPVQRDRQAWKWNKSGHHRKKFVKIRAVLAYFQEMGLDWK